MTIEMVYNYWFRKAQTQRDLIIKDENRQSFW